MPAKAATSFLPTETAPKKANRPASNPQAQTPCPHTSQGTHSSQSPQPIKIIRPKNLRFPKEEEKDRPRKIGHTPFLTIATLFCHKSPIIVYNLPTRFSMVLGSFRSNAMKLFTNLTVSILVLIAGSRMVAAQAQGGGGGGGDAGPPASQQQVRDEVRQLLNDLDDPTYDYSKVPPRIRQVFQDMRSATQSMDPDQAQQFRSDMMQLAIPVIQRHQAQIQEAMQMAFLKSLQEPLGSSDDEFSALKPGLEKVVQAMREAGPGFPGFGRGPGGPGGFGPPPSGQPVSEVDKARQELQATLDNADSGPDVIKAKLDSYRAALKKAKQDLAVARDALRSMLTVRQEAVLVDRGILD
jgi:hypothetical protein